MIIVKLFAAVAAGGLLQQQLFKLAANLLHRVVGHQQHILNGQAKDVACEKGGEKKSDSKLIIREVSIGADQQRVAKILVGQQFLHHWVLRFEKRRVHHKVLVIQHISFIQLER